MVSRNHRLVKHNYVAIDDNSCLWNYKGPDPLTGEAKEVWVLLYVDDLWIFSNSINLVVQFKEELRKQFTFTDQGEMSSYLGVGIERDRTAGTIKLSQTRYTKEIITKAGGYKVNEKGTPIIKGRFCPMNPLTKLVRNEGEEVDWLKYQSILGAIIFLVTCTRIDIAQAVSDLSRYMSNPDETHHEALEHLV